MKSQLSMLISVACCLITEASGACAYQDSEKEKDISRLRVQSKIRGLELFTLDLPSLDGILTSGLESGLLSTANAPLSKRKSKDDLRPRFLWGLWSLIFDSSGELTRGVDPNAILYLRQIFCLGKKLTMECSPDRIKSVVEKYHEIESKIVAPQLSWDGDDLGRVEQDLSFSNSFGLSGDTDLFSGNSLEGFSIYDTVRLSRLLTALDFSSRAVVSVLGDFNAISGEESFGTGRFRHGPGAVADLGEHSFKYAFPNWPRKLDSVFPYDWCGSHTIVPERYPSEHEPPSRLLAVPKTAKGPRLIASEPVAHQWCQQKIAGWISAAIERSFVGKFINLRNQSLSQNLVREASIQRHLTTLDLSDASDRLSCRHVESLLRDNNSMLEAVHAVRTRWVVDRVRSGQPAEFLRLKKFAAQGSALTFPMQSLFFLACCFAACGATTWGRIGELGGSVRVYGDDLIVPTYAHADLRLLLNHLGLKVNDQKSFWYGHFRESCGMDCWNGYDVTPLKPKSLSLDTPEQCQAMVDTSNNFYLRGFWQVSQLLDSTLRTAGFRLPVAPISSGVPVLKSFSGADISTQLLRWNAGYHRWEILIHRLMKPMKRVRQDVSETLLQYFTEAPAPDQLWMSGVSRERAARFAPRWVDLASVVGDSLPPAPSQGLRQGA